MSSQFANDVLVAQLTPPGERQMPGGSRSVHQLRCPIRIAYPNLGPAPRTCDNNCNGIRRVKEHLYKHHKCTCPGQPEPCQNPLHLGSKELKKLRALRRHRDEIPGEQWRRIYEAIHPSPNKDPAPYVPSASDLKAIACAPPPSFIEKLAENRHESIEDTRRFLAKIPHFIDLACLMGLYLDPQSAATPCSNNTTVSEARTSEQGPVEAEHRESADGDQDWEKFINQHDTY